MKATLDHYIGKGFASLVIKGDDLHTAAAHFEGILRADGERHRVTLHDAGHVQVQLWGKKRATLGRLRQLAGRIDLDVTDGPTLAAKEG